MRKKIHPLTSFLLIAALFTCVIGCAAFTDDDDDYNSPEFGRYTMGGQGGSILVMLGKDDPVAAAHMMRDVPTKGPWMVPEDREYLEEQCGDCHDLNRVYWTRGPISMWETIINEEQHLEMELEPEDKNRLFYIFQQYLNKS